jgi:putative methionine-R-sulfoxide reductase with GAF domain
MTLPESIRPFLETPPFDDEREQVRAHLLNIITLAAFILFLILPILLSLIGTVLEEPTLQVGTIWTLILLIVVRILLYRRRLVFAGYSLLVGGFLILAYQAMMTQGMYSPRFLATNLLVLVSAIILGTRQAYGVVVASFLLGLYLFFFGNNVPLAPFTVLVLVTSFSLLTVLIISSILSTLFQTLDQIKKTNAELEQIQEASERRIMERTRTLETILALSRELSLILDQDLLFREMVERIQATFDFYYTQIYLLNRTDSTLTLVAGTGMAGQKLLAAGHKLSMGDGLVGQAALDNRPVLVPDVHNNSQWLPNPHLPDTCTEAVIPISIGNHVLAVLDVQQDTPDSLTIESVDVLQTMANQAAIALQNARLYAAAAQRAQNEAQINAINEQIQQANSVESVLQVAAEGLGKALSSRRTTVFLHPAGNQKQNILVPNGERN